MQWTFRSVADPSDPGWARFMELYELEFEEGQRETEDAIVRNLAPRSPRPGGHIAVVAETETRQCIQCIGGALFSYLPAVNCGYGSYLVVVPNLRGRGLGSLLLKEMMRRLDEEARRADRPPVVGLFVEIEREDPAAPETYQRFRFWEKNGVFALDFDWRYPRLHGGELPALMYLAFGSAHGLAHHWYPSELVGVTRAIFDATYWYLSDSADTANAITNSLRDLPEDRPVRYLSFAYPPPSAET
jgi:GNAT superfamily N-acetyltransferase